VISLAVLTPFPPRRRIAAHVARLERPADHHRQFATRRLWGLSRPAGRDRLAVETDALDRFADGDVAVTVTYEDLRITVSKDGNMWLRWH
jgi:hypothetical protein